LIQEKGEQATGTFFINRGRETKRDIGETGVG